LLEGRQEGTPRLRPQGERSKATRSRGNLSIKSKAMEKKNTSGFVDEIVQEMYEIVGNGLPEETKEKLAVSIGLSLKQSFLNGIEVGLKKRQNGQDSRNKKPYRKFSR
jgi:hypothetical protein